MRGCGDAAASTSHAVRDFARSGHVAFRVRLGVASPRCGGGGSEWMPPPASGSDAAKFDPSALLKHSRRRESDAAIQLAAMQRAAVQRSSDRLALQLPLYLLMQLLPSFVVCQTRTESFPQLFLLKLVLRLIL